MQEEIETLHLKYAPEEDKEPIYRDQISPLLDRIINVCQQNGIPMLMAFELQKVEDGEKFISSVMVPQGASITLRMCGLALSGQLNNAPVGIDIESNLPSEEDIPLGPYPYKKGLQA